MTVSAPKIGDFHNKTRISILDDDILYGKVIEYQLNSRGFSTTFCSSTSELFQRLATNHLVDVFILDFYLGSGEPNGLEICRKVKAYCDRPVIMLTSNNSVETLVSCLNAGADQYIVKPCDIRELVARVEVTLRNYQLSKLQLSTPLELQIDESLKLSGERECLVHNDGRTIRLTPQELGMLELILKEPNKYIDRNKAFLALYGYEMEPSNRSIDLLASKIRKKLSDVDSAYTLRSLRGYGYVLSKLS